MSSPNIVGSNLLLEVIEHALLDPLFVVRNVSVNARIESGKPQIRISEIKDE